MLQSSLSDLRVPLRRFDLRTRQYLEVFNQKMRDNFISVFVWFVALDEALCYFAEIVHIIHVLLKSIGSAF